MTTACRKGVLNTTLCDKVLLSHLWQVPDAPVSSSKVKYKDITEILLKVALNNQILWK